MKKRSKGQNDSNCIVWLGYAGSLSSVRAGFMTSAVAVGHLSRIISILLYFRTHFTQTPLTPWRAGTLSKLVSLNTTGLILLLPCPRTAFGEGVCKLWACTGPWTNLHCVFLVASPYYFLGFRERIVGPHLQTCFTFITLLIVFPLFPMLGWPRYLLFNLLIYTPEACSIVDKHQILGPPVPGLSVTSSLTSGSECSHFCSSFTSCKTALWASSPVFYCRDINLPQTQWLTHTRSIALQF